MSIDPAGDECRPIDWAKIDGYLMREFHLRPWELDAFTLPEISLLLERPEDRQIKQSGEEIQASVANWRAMSPKERLLSRRRQR